MFTDSQTLHKAEIHYLYKAVCDEIISNIRYPELRPLVTNCILFAADAHRDGIDAPQVPAAAPADIMFISVHCQSEGAKIRDGTAGSDRGHRIQGNAALSSHRQERRPAMD